MPTSWVRVWPSIGSSELCRGRRDSGSNSGQMMGSAHERRGRVHGGTTPSAVGMTEIMSLGPPHPPLSGSSQQCSVLSGHILSSPPGTTPVTPPTRPGTGVPSRRSLQQRDLWREQARPQGQEAPPLTDTRGLVTGEPQVQRAHSTDKGTEAQRGNRTGRRLTGHQFHARLWVSGTPFCPDDKPRHATCGGTEAQGK